MSLCDIEIDDKVIIKSVESSKNIKRRLLDMGLIEGTCVECVLKSMFNDPKAYLVRGTIISIRNEDSKYIMVEKI